MGSLRKFANMASLNEMLQDTNQYEEAIKCLVELAHAGKQIDRVYANICIIYDHLKQPDSMKKYLKTPDDLESEDFYVWFVFGFLHQKLSLFEKAIRCYEAALRTEPDDVNAVYTLLGLGYCHEGLSDFDRAIETEMQAFELAKRLPEKLPKKRDLLAEVHHALGHFYTGRCRTKGLSVQDRDMGDHHMRMAVDLSPIYSSCMGTICAETKRFRKAIELLNWAIETSEVSKDPSLLHDCLFTRGYAYLGIEEYDKALADFRRVEDFVSEVDDRDALAHVKLSMIRAELKQRTIHDLTVDDIQSYLKVLTESSPSDYVVQGFGGFLREHRRMACFLKGLYWLKRLLSEDVLDSEDEMMVTTARHFLEMGADQLPLLVITTTAVDSTGDLPSHITKSVLTPLELERGVEEQLFDRFDVWLLFISADTSPWIFAKLLYYIGRYGKDATIVCYDESELLPTWLRKSDVILWSAFQAEALELANLALLYDYGKRYLAEPEIPYGLVPITAAPAPLVAQTGVLTPLPLRE